MIRYTKQQREFLIKNNYMKTSQELADLFEKEFDIKLTRAQIKSFRGNNKLDSGLTGRFEKGHSTFNKGKKWNEYMSKQSQKSCRKTTFKKGNRPHNYRPVGSERITVDGFIEIKVADPNKWDLKSRVICQEKYGKIPKGYKIIYLDGNRLNLDINNLRAVSYEEELIMNTKGYRFNNAELTNTGHILSQIESKIRKLKK